MSVQIKFANRFQTMGSEEFFHWEPDMVEKLELQGAELIFDLDETVAGEFEDFVEKTISFRAKPLMTLGSCTCGDCWWRIKSLVREFHGRAEYVIYIHTWKWYSEKITFEDVDR